MSLVYSCIKCLYDDVCTNKTIIFLLNHMLTYCVTVDLGKIVLKCKYRVRIEHLFDRKSLLSS